MGVLNSIRDVFGVPFYPVIFQVLMVLTFALHIICVNVVIGGTAVAIWGRLKGSDYSLRLSRAFARANTVMTSLAIVLGVAPLLFVQVIYDPFWYTSGNLSAWWTLIFLVAIAAAFSFAYLFYLGKRENGGSLFWALLSFVSLIVAAVIIHALSVQIIHPEKWSSWVVSNGHVDLSGSKLHAIEIPRFLHFILPSFAITGVYMMLYGWYFRGKYSDSYTQWVAELGAKIALYASCLQGLAGIWWLLTTPTSFMFHPITLVGVLAAAAFVGYLFKVQSDPIGKALSTGFFAFVAVFLMSAVREFLRYTLLTKQGYNLYAYKMSMSVGSTVLFFVTFVMGLLVIAYPIAVVYKLGKSTSEEPLELKELDGFGKIAAALPVVWFVVVAVLGIVISLKNGTLF